MKQVRKFPVVHHQRGGVFLFVQPLPLRTRSPAAGTIKWRRIRVLAKYHPETGDGAVDVFFNLLLRILMPQRRCFLFLRRVQLSSSFRFRFRNHHQPRLRADIL
jgi:hypothetical protein